MTETRDPSASAEVTAGPASTAPPDSSAPEIVGPIPRRRVDAVLVATGAVVAVVLIVSGLLLLWGHNFANDNVSRELTSQHITFPDAASLQGQGRTDLLGWAGKQVTTGNGAQAYASFIAGHLAAVADGATYADLSGPERQAQAAVQAAKDKGSPQATVDELQAKSDAITTRARHALQGGDAARPAAVDVRLGDDREDRRHRRDRGLRRRRPDAGVGRARRLPPRPHGLSPPTWAGTLADDRQDSRPGLVGET